MKIKKYYYKGIKQHIYPEDLPLGYVNLSEYVKRGKLKLFLYCNDEEEKNNKLMTYAESAAAQGKCVCRDDVAYEQLVVAEGVDTVLVIKELGESYSYEQIQALQKLGVDVYAGINIQKIGTFNHLSAQLKGITSEYLYTDALLSESSEIVLVDVMTIEFLNMSSAVSRVLARC